MLKTISIFISSAMTELEHEREIAQETLADLNFSPLLFEIFPALSQSPSEAYIEEVRKCDIFVLLIWKSFRPAVKSEYEEAIKMNKPILVFIKSLVGDEEREVDAKNFIKSLQDGISIDGFVARKTVYRNYRELSQLRKSIRESVMVELAKYYNEPEYTHSREEMYELGSRLISQAQKRLYICQQTPSLILGAREYLSDSNNKLLYEKQFLNMLNGWIEQNKTNVNVEFCYFFSQSNMELEIQENKLLLSSSFAKEIQLQIIRLCRIEKETERRFRFSMTHHPFSGPLAISDNRYAIWILGKDDAVSVSKDDEKFCTMVSKILRTYSQIPLEKTSILKICGTK